MKLLVAIPVYNEENYVEKVLDEVRKYSSNIVVVNDGSTDRTGKLLARQRGLTVLTHQKNRGYGAALITVFSYALNTDSDIIITMDCDGQHEPARIPVLYEAIHDADIVSGSRYLRDFHQDSLATPADRLEINRSITGELNARLGLNLTDAFCGFKAYRRSALLQLHPTVASWGMPLQVWVQAACHGLRVKEVAVPRIYLDPKRAFGGVLDEADARLAYYRRVIAEALDEECFCCASRKDLCSCL